MLCGNSVAAPSDKCAIRSLQKMTRKALLIRVDGLFGDDLTSPTVQMVQHHMANGIAPISGLLLALFELTVPSINEITVTPITSDLAPKKWVLQNKLSDLTQATVALAGNARLALCFIRPGHERD